MNQAKIGAINATKVNSNSKAGPGANNKAKANSNSKAGPGANNKTKANNNSKAKANNSKAKANNNNKANANNNNKANANNNAENAQNQKEINALNNIEKQLTEEQEHMSNINSNIADLQDAETAEEPFYVKHKKLFIGIAVILLIIVIYFLGKYIYNRYFKKTKTETQKLHINNHSSATTSRIPNDEIVPPRNGFDYSITFWFYIEDLYENFGKWRHVLHKGSYDGGNVLNFEKWHELSTTIREQAPGIWLHPSKPIIRFAVTIHPDKEYCGIFTTPDDCKDKYYCEWDGFKCDTSRKHPGDMYNDQKIDYLYTREGETIIQYIDIEVPVKRLVHLSYVFDQKALNVFFNGELHSVAKFMGEPIWNKHDMHLCLKNAFSGRLIDFNYFPDTISSDKIATLYKKLPMVEEVPKRKRISKSLGKGDIGTAFKTLFS